MMQKYFAGKPSYLNNFLENMYVFGGGDEPSVILLENICAFVYQTITYYNIKIKNE
jgi:hypothetical protein